MLDIKDIFKFAEFLYKFQQVKRCQYAVGEDRRETDTEHSYQLAMMAWYIINANNLDLDLNLIMKYALIHDLVEVYAGDTFAFEKNPEIKNSKHEREMAALEQIKEEFPEFKDLYKLILQYEQKEDKESLFVQGIDKVMCETGNYLEGGRSSKQWGWTLEEVIANQRRKTKDSPEIQVYSEQLISLLQDKENEIYPAK